MTHRFKTWVATAGLALCLGGMAAAQSLSSPIAAPPAGSGAGTHGAGSPFAPLQARNDVIPWSVLTDVKTRTEKNRILPVFNASQTALNQKTQRIQGFMMPLEPGTSQRHFLLSSVPLTCSFCTAGGPESMVEVRTMTMTMTMNTLRLRHQAQVMFLRHFFHRIRKHLTAAFTTRPVMTAGW